jgi:hypothetical protein
MIRPRLTPRSVRAWMGGDRPQPLAALSQAERRDVSVFFQEQCRIYSDYWGDLPRDAQRTFWNRARYDAHATHRGPHDGIWS